MIMRRLADQLSKQNWAAIGLEFVLLVTGVFLGLQASNWNEERKKKQEVRELLGQVGTELAQFSAYLRGVREYYAVTDRYARQAESGWAGKAGTTDAQFVIAAYQASQVTSVNSDGTTWSVIFGADRLRDIENVEQRTSLIRIMTFDYRTIGLDAVSTPYRQNVRRLIPGDIQAAIRQQCGDRPADDEGKGNFTLPDRCDIALPAEAVRLTAQRLRATPALVDDLHWHRAAVDNQLLNVATLQDSTDRLVASLKKAPGRPAA